VCTFRFKQTISALSSGAGMICDDDNTTAQLLCPDVVLNASVSRINYRLLTGTYKIRTQQKVAGNGVVNKTMEEKVVAG
jgi:hypothetical protein